MLFSALEINGDWFGVAAGLLRRCSVDGDAGAAFLRKNRGGDDLAGYMYVPQNSSKATGWALRV